MSESGRVSPSCPCWLSFRSLLARSTNSASSVHRHHSQPLMPGHVRWPSSASYLESFLPTKVGPPITMRHISKKARGCLHVPVYPSQVTEWLCENCRAHLNAMMDALRCRRHRNSREAPRRTYNSKQNPIFYMYETHWAQKCRRCEMDDPAAENLPSFIDDYSKSGGPE